MSETVKAGKFVSVTYSICDTEGNVLEQNDLAVSYIHGGDMELIGGMDKKLEGKKAGDRVEFTVDPKDGFGEPDPNLMFTDDIENVPPQFRQLGAEVQMQNDQGETKTFHVTKIENGQLTVDGNHPMAGKTLLVTVNIQEVRDATAEDAMQLTGGGQHSLN